MDFDNDFVSYTNEQDLSRIRNEQNQNNNYSTSFLSNVLNGT